MESERGAQPPADEDRVAGQERAAADEAGAIGGDAGEEQDPAARAVEEGGGGVAEGFELSEKQLREHAEHDADLRSPARDAFEAEPESDRSTAAHGEPDRRDPPEPDPGRPEDADREA